MYQRESGSCLLPGLFTMKPAPLPVTERFMHILRGAGLLNEQTRRQASAGIRTVTSQWANAWWNQNVEISSNYAFCTGAVLHAAWGSRRSESCCGSAQGLFKRDQNVLQFGYAGRRAFGFMCKGSRRQALIRMHLRNQSSRLYPKNLGAHLNLYCLSMWRGRAEVLPGGQIGRRACLELLE